MPPESVTMETQDSWHSGKRLSTESGHHDASVLLTRYLVFAHGLPFTTEILGPIQTHDFERWSAVCHAKAACLAALSMQRHA